MAFYLQDPGDPDTTYLLEILIQECQSATGGGASFAWATQRGVNLLLENKHFVDFVSKSNFDLVVGVDAVTDEKALETLARIQGELAGLTVTIFLNTYSGPLFHPKVCWFRQQDEGKLITGSGNLTEGGLSRNWEAFTVTDLDEEALKLLGSQWSKWKDTYGDDLHAPMDDAVVKRARKNKWQRPKVAKGKKIPRKQLASNKHVGIFKATKAIPKPLEILVAEIPRGSTRWNQANFDLDNYENFFGAKVGTQRHMFFRHVEPDGTLAATETRPSVAVKSSNWRFELAAAAGLPYPSKGRPIGVFVRQASRNFLYRLVMPGDAGHASLEKFLAANWHGPAQRMKRVRTSLSILQKEWPASPIWKVSEPEPLES